MGYHRLQEYEFVDIHTYILVVFKGLQNERDKTVKVVNRLEFINHI